ncbi:MAG: SCO6745 family protein [Acidimicrobiales bacterium]
MGEPSPSRIMWEATERFHGVCYVAAEMKEESTAAGLKGSWMGYFAGRIAPAGPVSAAVVSSTFFYFGPARVNRAIPDAWTLATPEAVIAARYRGVDRGLRSILGDRVDSAEVREAAELVRHAAAGCEPIGRLLHAAWASLEWPADAHLALWHGCTLLREYRSGNHLMAVCCEGLDGCEAVVSHVAVGDAPRDWIRSEAGWTEADEASAVARLQARGWLDGTGAATAECRRGRQRIEDMTDRLDAPVWDRLGDEKCRRLFELLAELSAPFPPDDQLDWQQLYDQTG